MHAIFTSDVKCLKLDNYLNRILTQPSTVWGRLLHSYYAHVSLAAGNEDINQCLTCSLLNYMIVLVFRICPSSLDDPVTFPIIKECAICVSFPIHMRQRTALKITRSYVEDNIRLNWKKTVRIICCYVMSDAAKFENPNTVGFCAKSNTAVITDSVKNTNLREEKGLSSEKIKSTDWDNLATLLQERIIINSSTALKQWEQLNISVGEHTENRSCLGKFAQG